MEQVKAFYQNQYGAKRTSVYVAGKFDATLRETITKAWNEWTPGPEPRIEVAKAQIRPNVTTLDRPSAPQSTIVIGMPIVDPSHPDYLRLRATNSLLGGSFGSRITRGRQGLHLLAAQLH